LILRLALAMGSALAFRLSSLFCYFLASLGLGVGFTFFWIFALPLRLWLLLWLWLLMYIWQ
jgi:hypothetical protein